VREAKVYDRNSPPLSAQWGGGLSIRHERREKGGKRSPGSVRYFRDTPQQRLGGGEVEGGNHRDPGERGKCIKDMENILKGSPKFSSLTKALKGTTTGEKPNRWNLNCSRRGEE